MQGLPSVSIVTPSFNHAAHIEATIASVLDQNYPALDYLVMDGGSHDGTLDILRRHDGRLRWISEPDRGQSDAINKGFARTQGEIFAWINSDDTYAPSAIRAAAEYFANHPEVDIVYGLADYIDARGRFIARAAHIEPFDAERLLNVSDFIVQPAAFIRRSAFAAIGGVDPGLHWAMDWDLWLKLARRHRFAFLPRLLAHYRWLGGNKSGQGGVARIEEIERMARRHGARGLPAYCQLEKVLLHAQRRQFAAAAATVLGSPRAMGCLFNPQVWRIIATGRRLRRSALSH